MRICLPRLWIILSSSHSLFTSPVPFEFLFTTSSTYRLALRVLPNRQLCFYWLKNTLRSFVSRVYDYCIHSTSSTRRLSFPPSSDYPLNRSHFNENTVQWIHVFVSLYANRIPSITVRSSCLLLFFVVVLFDIPNSVTLSISYKIY